MKTIISSFYNEKGLLSSKLNTELKDYSKEFKKEYTEIHNTLNEIFNKHQNFEVGVIDELEGGLAWDYDNVEDGKRWRFILGFTELGYWIYCNAPIENLKNNLLKTKQN